MDLNLIKKPKYFEHGDILISKTINKSPTIEKVVFYLGKENSLASGDVDLIKHQTNQNTSPKPAIAIPATSRRNKTIQNS